MAFALILRVNAIDPYNANPVNPINLINPSQKFTQNILTNFIYSNIIFIRLALTAHEC